MRLQLPTTSAFAALLTIAFVATTATAAVSPMPYRPGYGLGSWMPPNVVQGMKKEAYARSAIMLTHQMEAMSTSLAREFRMAMAPTQNPLSTQQNIGGADGSGWWDKLIQEVGIDEMRQSAWTAKVDAYKQLFDSMKAQVKDLEEAAKSGQPSEESFSTFASAVESPVVWSASTIGTKDRAFDSISTSSIYLSNADVQDISTTHNEEHSHETSHNDTSTSQAGARRAAIQKLYKSLGSGTTTHDTAGETAAALAKTYSVHSVESTLILSSFATHRMVKQFTNLITSPDKLRMAWNYFKTNDTIPHPLYATTEFATAFGESVEHGNYDDKISMVAEMFQGSTIVGMVHFLKADRMTQTAAQSSATTRVSATEAMEFAKFVASQSGSTSSVSKAADSIATMASTSVVDVVFDFVCVGYIPPLKSDLQSQTVRSIVQGMDPASKPKTEEGAKGQMQQQSDSKAIVEALMESANTVTISNPVMGMKTFMDAFNNYVVTATEHPEKVGAPVGMNLKEWSKVDVMSALAEYYFGMFGDRAPQDTESLPNGGTQPSSGGDQAAQ